MVAMDGVRKYQVTTASPMKKYPQGNSMVTNRYLAASGNPGGQA